MIRGLILVTALVVAPESSHQTAAIDELTHRSGAQPIFPSIVICHPMLIGRAGPKPISRT